MLGKTVYYLDFKNKTVKEGVVYDIHITSTGYSAYQLLVDNNFIQVETSLCSESKEYAERALPDRQKLADEITEYAKNAQAKVDEMRKILLGEPEYSHLKGIK